MLPKLSPDSAEDMPVTAALVPPATAPEIRAVFTPIANAGSAAPPVQTVAATPIAIAAAPIVILTQLGSFQ